MSSVPPTVTTVSRYSLGADLRSVVAAVTGSNNWPAASRVIYIPIYLPVAMTIQQFIWINGGAASGNVDIGVYSSVSDLPSSKVASTGSTAVSGTNVLQAASITPHALSAGNYFLAGIADSAGVWMYRTLQSTFTTFHTTLGICIEAGSGSTLPSTATPVAAGTQNYIPVLGFATVTVI